MDRRQLKTRKAILRAFRTMLEKKRYDHITVQEIIDEADIGRSTFYAHFETKDLLLNALCEDIFNHIFENDPCPWTGRDEDLEGKLSHTLWHIRDSKQDLAGILLSDSGELFLSYFKSHVKTMFSMFLDNFSADVPTDFLLDHLSGSFSQTVLWWIKNDMRTSPDTTAWYFMQMVRTRS